MPPNESLTDIFKALAARLQDKHGYSAHQLKQLLDETSDTIPATAFDNDLTPLQTLLLYCDQEQQALLNRPTQTLHNAKQQAEKKQPHGLEYEETTHRIPIEIFGDRSLSPLEHICSYLKEHGLRNKDIADLTGRSQKAVWTVLNRAKKKRSDAAR